MFLSLSRNKLLLENVQASNDFDLFVDWISESVPSGPSSAPDDSHVRLLALLVGGKLVSNLTNGHQIETARKLLNAITKSGELHTLEGDGMHEFSETSFEDGLLKSVVLKPNSHATLQRAQLSVIARMPSIRPNGGEELNWFCDNANVSRNYCCLRRTIRFTMLKKNRTSLMPVSCSCAMCTSQ